MQRSRLPVGGGNIFQKIRAKRSETAAQGMELFDLSIGEPKGPALMSDAKMARPLSLVAFDDIALQWFGIGDVLSGYTNSPEPSRRPHTMPCTALLLPSKGASQVWNAEATAAGDADDRAAKPDLTWSTQCG